MILEIANINEFDIEETSKDVSSARIEKASKYKYEIDKKRSIAVEYLLNRMIKKVHPLVNTPVVLEYDDKKKPHLYFEEKEIHFSLSHSGEYVACIISDSPCGIDIEKHSETRDYKKIVKRVCTEKELLLIDSETDFYNLWTLKESVLKAIGLGLSLDMKAVELEEINNANSKGKKKYRASVDKSEYLGEIIMAPEGYSLSYVEKI